LKGFPAVDKTDMLSQSRIDGDYLKFINEAQNNEITVLLCPRIVNDLGVNAGFVCAVVASPDSWAKKMEHFIQYYEVPYSISIYGSKSNAKSKNMCSIDAGADMISGNSYLVLSVPVLEFLKIRAKRYIDILIMEIVLIFMCSILFYRYVRSRSEGKT